MGLKGGLAVAAVAVADDELIAVAGELGHVDELRRKDRAFAREIRVDAVGDAVRMRTSLPDVVKTAESVSAPVTVLCR